MKRKQSGMTIDIAEGLRTRYLAGESPTALRREIGWSESGIYTLLTEKIYKREITLSLSKELFSFLTTAGGARGQSREQFALSILEKWLPREPETHTNTETGGWDVTAVGVSK